MMKINIRTGALFILSVLLYSACKHDLNKDYNQLVAKELESGKRADSIFFGIYLGMPAKDFYMHCWELNKKGLFTDGNNNTAVLHRLNHNELKYPASMNFYPQFVDNKIVNMPVSFQYDAWAPWNKHLFADSLLPDVVNLYKKWYSSGNPFIEMEDKKRMQKIYVKVDGNRRIIIGKFNEMLVNVDYTDLVAERQLKK
jgi:hypothetical protein